MRAVCCNAIASSECYLPLPMADNQDPCYLPVICQHRHLTKSHILVSRLGQGVLRISSTTVCLLSSFSLFLSLTPSLDVLTASLSPPIVTCHHPVNDGSRTSATGEKEERPSEGIKGQAPTAWGQAMWSSEKGPQTGCSGSVGCSRFQW